MGALYAIEREGEHLSHEERGDLRRRKSVLQLSKIQASRGAHSDSVPKSPLGKAIAFTLDRWPCPARYIDEGSMPIDNNAIERSIRPIAVGRKNWLFAGSPRGGHAAATFFTLLESCRRSGHNTFKYVSDILARIAQHPVDQLDQLLPDRWQPTLRTA